MKIDEFAGKLCVVKHVINLFQFDGPFWENLHKNDLIIPYETRMDGSEITIVSALTKYGVAQMYIYDWYVERV